MFLVGPPALTVLGSDSKTYLNLYFGYIVRKGRCYNYNNYKGTCKNNPVPLRAAAVDCLRC